MKQPVASTSAASSSSKPRQDLLAASSGFVHKKQDPPKGKQRQDEITIPLAEWAMGCVLYKNEDPLGDVCYFLKYNTATKVLTVHDRTVEGTHYGEFRMNRMCRGVQVYSTRLCSFEDS